MKSFYTYRIWLVKSRASRIFSDDPESKLTFSRFQRAVTYHALPRVLKIKLKHYHSTPFLLCRAVSVACTPLLALHVIVGRLSRLPREVQMLD